MDLTHDTDRLLRAALEAAPRIRIAHLPTPLEYLEHLTGELGVELWIKRDDQTGLAFGGNKTRKLEFIMADARRGGADTIVTWAGLHSNWCRQTAAAACRLGMGCTLVLFRRQTQPAEEDGNLLLDRLLGADVRIVPAENVEKYMAFADVREVLDPVVDELRSLGRSPYVAPIGGSMPEASMLEPWGAVAYADAFAEAMDQARAEGIAFDAVVFATGSGSTQAGLVLGAAVMSPQTRIIGISVSESREEMTAIVEEITGRTVKILGLNIAEEAMDIRVHDEYLGGGYGVLDDGVVHAVRSMAESEGILLDPVYTGKAMAGLREMVARGEIPAGSKVLFWHTGGTPALFPYRDGLLASA